MAEEETLSPPRIGFLIVWIIFIIIAGSVVLLITSLRVGQQNETTYGQVYKKFVEAWGGEINIIPANFYFEEQYSERKYNAETKKYEEDIKIRNHYVLPQSIFLNSNVNLDKRQEGLIVFNSFIVNIDNDYVLKNTTDFQTNLFIKFNRPENANIIYDYLVFIDDQLVDKEYNIDESFVLVPEFGQNQEIKVKIRFTTNGIDVYRYKLDVYNKYVMPSFKAVFNINTPKYNILRFSLPHSITKNGSDEQLTVEMKNFSTNQDVGVSFVSIINDLDQVERLVEFSPVSLAMFLVLVFILSQIKNISFHSVHYMFIAIINAFYFLFIAYIIRFFNIFLTLSLAFILTAIMYVLYIPNVTNKRFAFKILAPYHFALTTILSLIFLLPIYRGVSLITFLFVTFLSIMIPIGKSDFSKWPIFKNKKNLK
jgi:inner membrane protein involved in colicin E2 resistance